MKLIIGGACQGKLAFAKKTYQAEDGWIDGRTCAPEEIEACRGIYHFHEYVRRMLEGKEEFRFSLHADLSGLEVQAEAFADFLCRKNPQILIVSNELGYGVVPVEKEARLWREACGRMCTALAGRADEVVRVICGVGQKLAAKENNEEAAAKENSEEAAANADAGSPLSVSAAQAPEPCGAYFPIFVDLSQEKILVAGAGKIALRRIRVLLGFARRITVVAPDAAETLPDVMAEAAEAGTEVLWEQRPFRASDLEGKTMVLAATGDIELNERIAGLCRKSRIPVNVCSDRNLCDFQFPSIIRDGEIVVGVNASGRNHRLVKETRKKIEACLNLPEEESRY